MTVPKCENWLRFPDQITFECCLPAGHKHLHEAPLWPRATLSDFPHGLIHQRPADGYVSWTDQDAP